MSRAIFCALLTRDFTGLRAVGIEESVSYTNKSPHNAAPLRVMVEVIVAFLGLRKLARARLCINFLLVKYRFNRADTPERTFIIIRFTLSNIRFHVSVRKVPFEKIIRGFVRYFGDLPILC